MDLAEFKDRHAGATALLFGAGPGLATWMNVRPEIAPGTVVAAVNELPIFLRARGVPVHYAFAEDPTDHFAPVLPADVPLFLGACAVRESRLGNRRSPLDIPTDFGASRGSVILAARVLHVMGVARIVAVGIEGTRERCSDVPWISPPSLDRGASYRIIREKFTTECARLGLALEFWAPAPAEVAA